MASDKDATRVPALVRLPPHLRRRIYILVGLARRDGPDPHAYTYYLDGRKESRRSRSVLDPPPARNFAGLLLACRALYTEAAALLYSANRFVIFYSSEGSLGPLHALSPTSLASLTSLKVVLRESSCHVPVDSCNYPPYCCCEGRFYDIGYNAEHCAKYHSSLHSSPLLGSDSSSSPISTEQTVQAVLAEWRDAAQYLASHVGAGRLELLLVCDIDPEHAYALEVARLAVDPLALFPLLRDCHIWLSKTPNRPLQWVAEDAVVRARPIPWPLDLAPATAPSRLLSLPAELRYCILEYTDLITPWREIIWSRQYRGYQLWHGACTDGEGGCPPHIHHGYRLGRCSADAIGLENSIGCFCRRRHAAFSLTSCHCWAPPTNLFLVCRLLRQDAQFVFFSGNRFVIHDHYAKWFWCPPSELQLDDETTSAAAAAAENQGHYPYQRFAASEFLRDVVPAGCLGDLRFLELVFPPYEPDSWPLDQHPAVLDWRATVDWIRCEGNAPALTIRLIMIIDDRRVQVMTKDQRGLIVEGYGRIFRPLKDLQLARWDGLGSLLVESLFPMQNTPEAIRHRRRYGDDWWLEMEQELDELGFWDEPGRDDSASSRDTDEDDSESASSHLTAKPRVSVWQRWMDVIV